MAKGTSQDPIELDGRHLEGGGQLIRIALCLSALTCKSIKITDIRGQRPGGGGLKAQHLACVNWLAHACNAHVEGAEKGSKTLIFRPGQINRELSPAFKKRRLDDGDHVYECRLEIGTAGSTGLALQAILPFILFTRLPSQLPIHLTLTGGTNVSGSPSIDYIRNTLLPTLRNIGLPDMTATLSKRGWSHGGSSIGSFALIIPPRASVFLSPFTLYPPDTTKPSQPTRLHALFIAPTSTHAHFRSVLPAAIAKHFGPSSTSVLDITCESSLHEKRFYFLLVATIPITKPVTSKTVASSTMDSTPREYTLARDALSPFKIRSLDRAAADMATMVTAHLAREWASGGYVDEFMRDQLVVFQALAGAGSTVYAGRQERSHGSEDNDEDGGEAPLREPSLHARTAEWVARRMLGVRFDAEGRCEGCGFGAEEEAAVDEVVSGVEEVRLGDG